MAPKNAPTKPVVVTAPVVEETVAAPETPVEETQAPEDVVEAPVVEETTLPEDPEAEETSVVQTEAPVAVVETFAPLEDAVTEDSALDRLLVVDGSALLKIALADLHAYATAMASNQPQNKDSTVRWQKKLHDVYQLVFKLEPADFQKAMRVIVALFRENPTGAFTDGKLFRGIQDMQLPKNDIRLFNHLGALLLKAGELGISTAGRESDLSGIAKSLPTDQARQYLTQFFR